MCVCFAWFFDADGDLALIDPKEPVLEREKERERERDRERERLQTHEHKVHSIAATSQSHVRPTRHFKPQSSNPIPTNWGRHFKPQSNNPTSINGGRHFKSPHLETDNIKPKTIKISTFWIISSSPSSARKVQP